MARTRTQMLAGARIWIETELTLAISAFPVAEGHTLAVPRKHVNTIYELTIPEQGNVVTVSSAAQAALAAIKETQETPAQTAKEASGGDPQARRLLAKESASKVIPK